MSFLWGADPGRLRPRTGHRRFGAHHKSACWNNNSRWSQHTPGFRILSVWQSAVSIAWTTRS